MTLENTCNKVKIQGKLSPNFEMVVGLRQGDSLSTLLFNLCMEKIIKNVKTNPRGTIFNTTKQCLAYADDAVNLGHSVTYISETLEDLEVVETQIGLSMNSAKTKYMVNRKDNNNEPKEI
jgi:thymidine kinase